MWRIGVLISLSVVLFGLWCLAVYVTYLDTKRVKMEEAVVRPGLVHYGTPSVVSLLPASTPLKAHRLQPMMSGNTVRQLAYSGHASMPAQPTSQYKLYTTSSASSHTVGSGYAGVGGSQSFGGVSANSSRGIRYTNPSVSIPTPAFAQSSKPVYATASSSSSYVSESADTPDDIVRGRPKMVKPSYNGEDGDWINGGSGDWWYYDEDHWRNPYDGETRFDPTLGYTVVWNGSAWVKLTEYDPGVPVGDVPWALFLILAPLFIVFRFRHPQTSRVGAYL